MTLFDVGLAFLQLLFCIKLSSTFFFTDFTSFSFYLEAFNATNFAFSISFKAFVLFIAFFAVFFVS